MALSVSTLHDLEEAMVSAVDVTASDACAAVQIGYLAAELGGALTAADRVELHALCHDLCYVTGQPAPSEASAPDRDAGRDCQRAALRKLAREINSAARELAYAVAYLAIEPHDAWRAELVLDELRTELSISQRRSEDIAAIARRVATGANEAAAARASHS